MTKSIMDLEWRYATKNFDPNKKLSAEQLETLVKAFQLTATSYGLQPCRMVVIQNPELQEAMVPISFGQRQVVDASAVLVLCTTPVDSAYVKRYFDLVQKVRNTSEEILKPFRNQLEAKFDEMDQQTVRAWAKNQAYIALGNLMTVCAQERIDSCPMEGFLPEKMDDLLHLKEHDLQSALLLPVGYRAADDMFAEMKKVRLSQEDSVIFMP